MSDPNQAQRGYELPAPRTIRAAIRLLGDGSPRVVAAVRRMLSQCGEHARPELELAQQRGDAPTRMRARELLRELDVRSDLRRLMVLEFDGGEGHDPEPLLAGTALASRLVRTFVPGIDELRDRLTAAASSVRPLLVGRSLSTSARLLSAQLSGELGLHGCDLDDIQPDQVLIDRVLSSGAGVPVTLSMIYLLVARWAGLRATGVAIPEHFLVRLHGIRPVLVDPFHGGRTVTKIDCARYLRSLGYDQVRDHLRDQTDREVLAHYLRTLRRATAQRDAHRTLGDALLHLEAR